ncbi:lipopolysaccharide/colanic/teichoic acid biosynthesis glycosyltransferase [Rhizobium sullae]|uniref:Lipopolysaccharide/colanic/teichoic acid biosynthesis glycosyltransferase n=2 Tax=Rhizobium sullae TaxID=50338 RepID=A0A4R3PZK0_RHISU|nr:lipopolysaccharide/colanic/teichoic acid biosynthesis glycosyltransferase [Rhizobium sullae]
MSIWYAHRHISSLHFRESPKCERLPLHLADPGHIDAAVGRSTRYLFVRRMFDIAFVLASAPASVLLVGVAAAAVMVTMGRPVFLAQERVGYRGRTFRALKLRSMRTSDGTPRPTSLDDDRITPLGAFLRQSHLDELPQLWNVLVGQMSLIGPRPEWVPLARRYECVFPEYKLRYCAPPGLTGLAQVKQGYVSTIEEVKAKVEYDIYYILNISVAMDLKILLLTSKTIFNSALSR